MVLDEEFAFNLVNLLLDGITINVTDFFRDRDMWDTFTNDVLPQQLQEMNRRKNKILRIWSAGCSIGEEPHHIYYSDHTT